MSLGFGSQPIGYGHAGVEVPRPQPGSPLEQIADHLAAIRARFCLPDYRVKTPFTFTAAGQVQGVDCEQTVINAFTITVVTGTVSVWEGRQQANGGTIGLPDYQFGPGTTTQVLLAPSGYYFTLQATGGAASGVFKPQAL